MRPVRTGSTCKHTPMTYGTVHRRTAERHTEKTAICTKTTNTSTSTRTALNWTCSRLLATTSAPIGAPNEITAATTIAKGRRRGWRVLDGHHALHMHADSPTLPGVYQWATKKRHMWRTRCSGGKSAGSEHLRAACHRPSMWEGLYPLPTIRDGNTFDKITTLLTGAETVQVRLA